MDWEELYRKWGVKVEEKPVSEAPEATIEAFEEFRKATEEGISHLSRQIEEISNRITRLEGLFTNLSPPQADVTARLEAIESRSLDNKTRIERLEASLKEFSKTATELRSMLEKTKFFDSVLEEAKNIDQKIRTVEEKKGYVDMQVKKVEKLTADFQKVFDEFYQMKLELNRIKKEVADVLKLIEKPA